MICICGHSESEHMMESEGQCMRCTCKEFRQDPDTLNVYPQRDFVVEVMRASEEQRRRAAEYTGGPLPFMFMGERREALAPWMSHAEVADRVRMLMRDQVDHEAVCVIGRDRILHLSQELAAQREKFAMHTAEVSAWLATLAELFDVKADLVSDTCVRIFDAAKALKRSAPAESSGFDSVWTFERNVDDFRCIGIFSDQQAAADFAVAHPFQDRPAPVIHHDTVDNLIEVLLKPRLGVLADALLRVENMLEGSAPLPTVTEAESKA